MSNPQPRHTPPLPQGQVTRATLAAALVPGAGHWLLGHRRAAASLLLVELALVALAVVHANVGLSIFHNPLGSFLFGLLLRGVALLHAFGVLDVYLWGVDPGGSISPPVRRWSVLLNVLVPGAGYALARAWIRTATGLGLLVLVLVVTRSNRPHLDLVFMAMQVVMGLAVYRNLRIREAGEGHQPGDPLPMPDPLPPSGGGQVVLLVVSVAALLWICTVVLLAWPARALSLDPGATSAVPRPGRLEVKVKDLGLTMEVVGDGWKRVPQASSRVLLLAQHRDSRGVDGQIRLMVHAIPPFMGREAYLKQYLPAWLETNGMQPQRTEQVRLGQRTATQFQASARVRGGHDATYYIVALPGDGHACLLAFYCVTEACHELGPQLRRSRDSLRLE